MDISALIFVALAVAWAVYLIPKALEHHDEVVRSRSVERFSATMRVLARREPVNRRDARLVVTPSRQAKASTVETKATRASAPQPSYAARRAAAAKAARRRRNVLGLILLVNVVVIALAAAKVLLWPSVGAPAGLLVAWLVACRMMVNRERSAARSAARAAARAAMPPLTSTSLEVIFELPDTVDAPIVEDVPAALPEVAVAGSARAEGAWDMVPTTLPTYVSKPAAVRRTVQTIDLDSTGVWSSGRNDVDSALAREADESERASRKAADERRASGS